MSKESRESERRYLPINWPKLALEDLPYQQRIEWAFHVLTYHYSVEEVAAMTDILVYEARFIAEAGQVGVDELIRRRRKMEIQRLDEIVTMFGLLKKFVN